MQEVVDVDVPEVRAMHQNARFFREGAIDFVEISFVGSKDTLVKKVTPSHMAKFQPEWTAYCDGRPLEKRKGTPLTDVAGVNSLRAEQFIATNVHTAEELAALSDGQCQALGHGTITARREAQALLEKRAGEFAQTQMARIANATEKLTAPPAAPPPEIAEMKAEIAGLKEGVGAILAALAEMKPKKPGRPPKPQAE